MIQLFWQRSQEAEFRADYAGSRVAGTRAARSLLEKTPYAIYLQPVLDPLSFGHDWQGRSVLPDLQAFVANLPPLEVERARRAFQREKFAAGTSHPPSWARQGFLQRHPSEPLLRADPEEMALIDKELASLGPLVTSKLLARYYPDK